MKILLVDDHSVVRRGLSQLIRQEADLEVCGEATSVDEALRAIEETRPDVTLVDLSLRESNGFDLLKLMKERFPEVTPLVLTMHEDVGFAEKALRAGARGYVTKEAADEIVIEALRKVASGGLYLLESMQEEVLERLLSGPPQRLEDQIAALSERERAVFIAMGEGKNTREIGEALGLNLKTVETYRRRIKAKLDIDSMSKLAHMAFEYLSRGE
jgi:DNA-binding NarL/FixJ family response regulator